MENNQVVTIVLDVGNAFYRVRTPEVTFEDFKSEILIIDLKTGHYHSLRHSGACLWRLLGAGQSVESCVESMAASFGMDRQKIESDTRTFILELEKLGLITPSSEPGSPAVPASTPVGESYEQPSIESYGDLQDLLLLDPIHEIAPESGWPQRRENA